MLYVVGKYIEFGYFLSTSLFQLSPSDLLTWLSCFPFELDINICYTLIKGVPFTNWIIYCICFQCNCSFLLVVNVIISITFSLEFPTLIKLCAVQRPSILQTYSIMNHFRFYWEFLSFCLPSHRIFLLEWNTAIARKLFYLFKFLQWFKYCLI